MKVEKLRLLLRPAAPAQVEVTGEGRSKTRVRLNNKSAGLTVSGC